MRLRAVCCALRIPLAALLGVRMRNATLLSLDVEGSEDAVLETVDPAAFRVILVEALGDPSGVAPKGGAAALRAHREKNARVHARLLGAGFRQAPHAMIRYATLCYAMRCDAMLCCGMVLRQALGSVGPNRIYLRRDVAAFAAPRELCVPHSSRSTAVTHLAIARGPCRHRYGITPSRWRAAKGCRLGGPQHAPCPNGPRVLVSASPVRHRPARADGRDADDERRAAACARALPVAGGRRGVAQQLAAVHAPPRLLRPQHVARAANGLPGRAHSIA